MDSVEFTKKWGETLFPYKNNTKNYLEIGLFKGESLPLWKEYFNNCNVYGIDITLDNLIINKQDYNIFCFDATNRIMANNFLSHIKFDVIIDDSSPEDHYDIFQIYSKFLNESGIYIIETYKSKLKFYLDLQKLKKNFSNFRFEVIHSRNSKENAIACYKLT